MQTYPLHLFVKHRNRGLHRILERCRGVLFPETKTTSYRVFRDESVPGEGAGPR